MEPYRSAPTVRAAETPRDAGIVDDIIRQFADPMAFYRELVQNSIDAGTDAIDVRLRFSAESVKVAVIDRGEGMTRDVLENRLLVLFRSTKEKDDDKIGKFGVGFASVLALSPTVVAVTTVRDERRLALHLFRDLSYELFDAGRAKIPGTTVELDVPLSMGVEAFVDASVSSLVRWCRHARVPIHLTAYGLDNAMLRNVRIDRPLALAEPLVSISGESGDGMVAIVGFERGLQPYAGFFNHGLTLHESRDPAFGRLSFKVQDARLGHTMSRDNVRRDQRFHQAMAFVRSLARQDLQAETAGELRQALESGDLARYGELLAAVAHLAIGLGRDQMVFPLLAPIDGVSIASAADLSRRDVWLAGSQSKVTAALGAGGVAAVHDCHELVAHMLGASGVSRRGRVDELTLVTPLEPSDSDRALVDQLGELLDRGFRRPPAITLATLEGAHSGQPAITGSPGDTCCPGAWILDLADCGGDPFAWLLRPAMILNGSHPLIWRAREKSKTEPVLAAALLAQLLILHFRELGPDRSERIALETIERVLGLGEGGR